ncbi:hypothetical protein C5167_042659 [Papaver somniferum]|uniref:Uncharacterized protein n=1 Tax=Papaver somniferum TaxID=3469 RepID=A0A4Y7L3E8_PAPSO|nr:hypothetical protein C5167_042659 [Papaver somniferum]
MYCKGLCKYAINAWKPGDLVQAQLVKLVMRGQSQL